MILIERANCIIPFSIAIKKTLSLFVLAMVVMSTLLLLMLIAEHVISITTRVDQFLLDNLPNARTLFSALPFAFSFRPSLSVTS